MSDSTVGIVEPGSPTKLVDNEQRTNDNGDTVQRQRVAAPMLETLFSLLRPTMKKLALALDPATARLRVAIESAAVTITGVTTVTTVSTVTTCASVTNLAQIGGVAAGLDQYNSSKAAVAGLRSKITVT
jgi:hypothetical protein